MADINVAILPYGLGVWISYSTSCSAPFVDHMAICSVPVSCWFSFSVSCLVFVSLLLQQPINSDSNHQAPFRLLIHLMSQSPARLLIHLLSQSPALLLIYLMSQSPARLPIQTTVSSMSQMAIHVQVWGSHQPPVINHKTMLNTIVSIHTH